MFVTLDNIAKADQKHSNIFILENYAAFQNRYRYSLPMLIALVQMTVFLTIITLDADEKQFYAVCMTWPVVCQL